MSAMHLIFNELSLQNPAPTKNEARSRLQKLYDTVSAAIEAGRLESLLLVHEAFSSADLAPQYTLLDWLDDNSVDKPLREAVQALIAQAPFLDDLCANEDVKQYHVSFQQNHSLGMQLAAYRKHPVASLSVPPFEQDPLCILLVRGNSADPNTPLVNFHSPQSVRKRIPWLDARLLQRPIYKHAEHHDPSGGKFRGRGDTTSIIPTDAEEVYLQAISEDPGERLSGWWGINQDCYLYRYLVSFESDQYVAHWTGSTRPDDATRKLEDRIIPLRIRKAFPQRKQ